MTDKKTDALKLALSTLANARDWIGNDPEGRWDEDEMYDELCNMVRYVRNALADHIPDATKMIEQPAQQRHISYVCPQCYWSLDEQPVKQPDEFLLRGLLASELKCWHRLTEDEAQNLVDFVRNMPAKPAQQGWKLVPVEPTAEMRNAYHAVTDDDVTMKGAAGSRWFAMLNAAPQPAQQQSAEHYCVDAVAWETFIHDYDRYISGNPNYPWQNIREGLAAVIESATPAQPSKPLTDEEITKIWETRPYFNDFARAIEAKLRELNEHGEKNA